MLSKLQPGPKHTPEPPAQARGNYDADLSSSGTCLLYLASPNAVAFPGHLYATFCCSPLQQAMGCTLENHAVPRLRWDGWMLQHRSHVPGTSPFQSSGERQPLTHNKSPDRSDQRLQPAAWEASPCCSDLLFVRQWKCSVPPDHRTLHRPSYPSESSSLSEHGPPITQELWICLAES